MPILTEKRSNLLGFTLLELVIALTIGMLVILSTSYLYNSAMSIWTKVQGLRSSRIVLDFLYVVQNSLMSCKGVNVLVKEDHRDGIELRCYSSSAMSAPYVIVSLELKKEGILYREFSPVHGKLLYSVSLNKKIENFSFQEGFIMLEIDKMHFVVLVGNSVDR